MRLHVVAALVLLAGCSRVPPEGVGNAESGNTGAGSAGGTASGSTTAADSSSTSPTITASTGTATTGPVSCDNPTDITKHGVAGASTVFEGFPPILSMDGDLTTSWFSTGPEPSPTLYTWSVAHLNREVCITEIVIHGNGMHSNPEFRDGFGFGAVTIALFDADDELVFTELHDLPGTPDPRVTSLTGGVPATRIDLRFDAHEHPDCGGFAELEVIGRAR